MYALEIFVGNIFISLLVASGAIVLQAVFTILCHFCTIQPRQKKKDFPAHFYIPILTESVLNNP